MNKELKNMSLIGYRQDYEGKNMQLYMSEDNDFKVRYKGDIRQVEMSYLVVPKNLYKQEVDDLPYFVIDNNVFTLESFESIK